MNAETQRLESLCQRKLVALESQKKSLLHQAFTRMFHKLTRALAGLLFRMEQCSVGRMNNYAALQQNPPTKHKTKSCAIIARIYETFGFSGSYLPPSKRKGIEK